MGSCDRWEFPLVFRGHWQSSCTALTAGLPLGLCKDTVKESSTLVTWAVSINQGVFRHCATRGKERCSWCGVVFWLVVLTHWGLNKMATILQTKFHMHFLRWWIKHLIQISVNSSSTNVTYMRLGAGSALVQVMAWCLFGAKPLPEPMLIYCKVRPLGTNFTEIPIGSESAFVQERIWCWIGDNTCNRAVVTCANLWLDHWNKNKNIK